MKIKSLCRFFAVSLILLLSACSNQPKRLAFNREAQAPIKTISVLSMRKSEIELFILNNPGYSFGLIGVAIAEANRAPKSKWLKEQVEQGQFDHVKFFCTEFENAMRAQGYYLVWEDEVVESKEKRVRRSNEGFRRSYTAVASADAQLDLNFGFLGYASAGSGKSAPYRPTVVVSARLMDASGKTVLFEDRLIYNNVFPGNDIGITLEPDDRYRYPDFDDLKVAGSATVEGLRLAFKATADELARQF